MLVEETINSDSILSFLRGGGNTIDIKRMARDNAEGLARSVTYVLKANYHRQSVCKAVVGLINNAPPAYRGIGWKIIQEMPLSHLLEILNVMDKKDNTKRLRHALVTKMATSSRNELIKAFFMGPNAYRTLFDKFYLPHNTFNGNIITNKSYIIANKLSGLSIQNAMTEMKLKKADLFGRLKMPFEKVKDLIETPREASELALVMNSDTFLQHARWVKGIVGDDVFDKIAIDKIKDTKKSLEFLGIKDHLEETNALTPKLVSFLEEKASEALNEIMNKFELESLALIVDVSGSMHVAVKITKLLYEAFSKTKNITDIIAFNSQAWTVKSEDLSRLQCNGSTSCGSPIVTLTGRIRSGATDIPQAIIYVSDLQENADPPLRDSVKLLETYESPPLMIIHCGCQQRYVGLNYPHAIIPTNDFHKGLIMDIIEQLARTTATVAIKEKEVTKIIKKRRPIEEEIGMLELPVRPAETLRAGYLEGLLCPK